MYKLRMVIHNICYKPWWWNGKPFYHFDTVDELIDFMIHKIPMDGKDVKFIYDNDKKKLHGRLACTSWYEVEKGEHEMTEYTSL